MNKTRMFSKSILLAAACFLTLSLRAQSNDAIWKGDLRNEGNRYTLDYEEQAYDNNDPSKLKPLEFVVPSSALNGSVLYLEARGGDGGARTGSGSHRGGEGALITTSVKIGSGENEIPIGSRIRFIIGGYGQSSHDHGGGGGGGTGIVLKRAGSNKWEILAVAGGGGGGGADEKGQAAWDDEPQGSHSGRDGAGGSQASSYKNAGPGGGAYSAGTSESKDSKGGEAGMNSLGIPTGGAGGESSGSSGGFGFGGGGSSLLFHALGGGGGGYSGGGPSYSYHDSGVVGGGSYVNDKYDINSTRTRNGHTNDPVHGYIGYQFYRNPNITIDTFSFLSINKLAVDGSSASGLYFTEKITGLPIPQIKIPADALSSALMYPGRNIHLTFVDKDTPSRYFNRHYLAYLLGNGQGMVVSEDPVDIKAVGSGSVNYQVSVESYSNTDLKFYWYYKKKKDDDTYIPLGKSKKGEYEYDPGNEGKVEIAFNEAPNQIIKTITFKIPD